MPIWRQMRPNRQVSCRTIAPRCFTRATLSDWSALQLLSLQSCLAKLPCKVLLLHRWLYSLLAVDFTAFDSGCRDKWCKA